MDDTLVRYEMMVIDSTPEERVQLCGLDRPRPTRLACLGQQHAGPRAV